ncbi:cyclic nucleotide-gated channel 18 [Zostera marina]|uniref:Cyclic nucleotide-gated channel 18 n=1 Tax=Zostera marina TaxID=29655 RepID=A0A0K9PE92_ZOSMR|nr:cyclic nucleotide-gated channel 18 [Zostera marina]
MSRIIGDGTPSSRSGSAGLFQLPFRYAPLHIRPKPWQPTRILDPGSDVVMLWYRIFLVSCLVALFLDPFYFYILQIRGPACMGVDMSLGITVTFFRTIADCFYLLHMVLKFRIAFVAPSSRVFGRGELVRDPNQIAIRYLRSDFVIDLLAMLPIPQMILWFVVPAVNGGVSRHNNNTLSLFVLIQYLPRLFLIFPLNARIVKNSGALAKTAWAGAAYNLFLYMLASHGLGALWYLLSIERQNTCWVFFCKDENKTTVGGPLCQPNFLDCKSLTLSERHVWLNTTHVYDSCLPGGEHLKFNFGIFEDALTTEFLDSTFPQKYLYCLWWGLRNLSSYAQNLETSTYMGETIFCILICIVGLVLFSHLIGNMQQYLASMTVRLEEWRVKRRDTEEWMNHRQLPEDLQERVRRFVQYKWLATRGVDEESILQSLPMDLRRDIQRHLCLGLVRRVPFFSEMDTQLLDAICERLVSSLSTQDTYIVREGDPVNEMLFVIRGQLDSSTTNGGRAGFFNSITLRPGDFCGEELLTWALVPTANNIHLPSSTRTVRCLTEVEAFALRAEELKFVASQFKRLHSKKLRHAFRFYSHQWRTWGACFIQTAWRRYKKRKLAWELAKEESLYYLDDDDEDDDYDGGNLPSIRQPGQEVLDKKTASISGAGSINLGVTLLASKFAKNTKKGVNQKLLKVSEIPLPKEDMNMSKLFMKPDEPDFSKNHED